jgi:hypothetical protein
MRRGPRVAATNKTVVISAISHDKGSVPVEPSPFVPILLFEIQIREEIHAKAWLFSENEPLFRDHFMNEELSVYDHG